MYDYELAVMPVTFSAHGSRKWIIGKVQTRGQWPCRTCGELKVNKQLTISKILNFLSKHLCFEQFKCLKPPSGLFEKSKQTAESKQTADIIQNSEILFQTSFL